MPSLKMQRTAKGVTVTAQCCCSHRWMEGGGIAEQGMRGRASGSTERQVQSSTRRPKNATQVTARVTIEKTAGKKILRPSAGCVVPSYYGTMSESYICIWKRQVVASQASVHA